MGFLDDAQDLLDKGVTAAKGAVSNVAVEQFGYMKAFVRMCADGAQAGWHEGNGGNLSYRLTLEEVANTRSYFYTTPRSWVMLDLSPLTLNASLELLRWIVGVVRGALFGALRMGESQPQSF